MCDYCDNGDDPDHFTLDVAVAYASNSDEVMLQFGPMRPEQLTAWFSAMREDDGSFEAAVLERVAMMMMAHKVDREAQQL